MPYGVLITTAQTTFQTLQNLFMRNERVSAFSVGALMLVAVVLMGVTSLATLNSKSTNGYQLNELEAEYQELVQDAEVTDMLTLRARSMTVIEERALNMRKPLEDEVAYVAPVTVYAQKN